jgi:hypothetical protein
MAVYICPLWVCRNYENDFQPSRLFNVSTEYIDFQGHQGFALSTLYMLRVCMYVCRHVCMFLTQFAGLAYS